LLLNSITWMFFVCSWNRKIETKPRR